MEVGQGPNWGCSAKEKNLWTATIKYSLVASSHNLSHSTIQNHPDIGRCVSYTGDKVLLNIAEKQAVGNLRKISVER
jgi:hypothetical protein